VRCLDHITTSFAKLGGQLGGGNLASAQIVNIGAGYDTTFLAAGARNCAWPRVRRRALYLMTSPFPAPRDLTVPCWTSMKTSIFTDYRLHAMYLMTSPFPVPHGNAVGCWRLATVDCSVFDQPLSPVRLVAKSRLCLRNYVADEWLLTPMLLTSCC
jgi:hypothetical protein